MIKKIDKQFLLFTFVFISWVTMWVSINAIPYEIKDMTNSLINFLNGFRSIGAILFSLISLTILFFLIIFKKVKKLLYGILISVIIIFLLIYFYELYFDQVYAVIDTLNVVFGDGERESDADRLNQFAVVSSYLKDTNLFNLIFGF